MKRITVIISIFIISTYLLHADENEKIIPQNLISKLDSGENAKAMDDLAGEYLDFSQKRRTLSESSKFENSTYQTYVYPSPRVHI